VLLALEASVEAIFLSTFILITQNRMTAQADKRADLNLQISLLAEHEDHPIGWDGVRNGQAHERGRSE